MNPIDALQQQLARQEQLVSELSDEQYCMAAPSFQAGIGQHLRHSTDHVACLLDSWVKGIIRYDQRLRGTKIETQRLDCLQLLAQLKQRVSALRAQDLDRAVQVEHTVSAGGETAVLRSTLGRELIFVMHHAIHHDAQIAAQLRVREMYVDDDFGMAPATIADRRRSPAG